MIKIRKFKKPSFKEAFSYGPSRLAKKTVAVAEDKDNEEVWEIFAKRFFEVPVFVPYTTIINPNTKNAEKSLLLTRQYRDKTGSYVVMFEKEDELQTWLKTKAGISDTVLAEVVIESFVTGKDFLLSLDPTYFLDYKFMLDVGRRNKFIIKSHILDWLRKKALADKRKSAKK